MGRETSSLSNADRSVTPQLITYLQAYYDYRKPSFLVRCCGHWLGARWFRFISNRHYCFLCTIFIDISHVLFEYRLVIRRYYRYCCWKLICIAWMWDMTYSINFVDTFQNYTHLLQFLCMYVEVRLCSHHPLVSVGCYETDLPVTGLTINLIRHLISG